MSNKRNRQLLAFILVSFAIVSVRGQSVFRLPPNLIEVSGLVIDQQNNTFWWHNDGSHPAEVIQTNTSGATLQKKTIPESYNEDWEDMTVDPEGWLYVGDFGNNLGKRRQFAVYKYHPTYQQKETITYEYGGLLLTDTTHQYRPNCEAMVWYQDSLYLFTKDWPNSDRYLSKVYVLPSGAGHHIAQLRDSIFLKKRVVTGAAIDFKANQIALLSYRFKKMLGIFPRFSTTIWLFDLNGLEHGFVSSPIQKIKVGGLTGRQYEAIDFASDGDIWIASEKTGFLKARAKKMASN